MPLLVWFSVARVVRVWRQFRGLPDTPSFYRRPLYRRSDILFSYLYVHGTRFYYKSPTSYNSGSPFDIHREQSVNVGWLDGHVSLADEGTLRRNFINDDTIFVSEL